MPVPPATFHNFPRLPAELRAHIWKFTIQPRIIYLNFRDSPQQLVIQKNGTVVFQDGERKFVSRAIPQDYEGRHVSKPGCMLSEASVEVPATLHTCREARAELTKYYRPAFSELYKSITICNSQQHHDHQPRYSWVNFDVDVIHIGRAENARLFTAIAPSVKRLRFDGYRLRYHGYQLHISDTRSVLSTFTNMEEIFIESSRWPEIYRAMEELSWPCDKGNVWIIDRNGGLKRSISELDSYARKESDEDSG